MLLLGNIYIGNNKGLIFMDDFMLIRVDRFGAYKLNQWKICFL